MKRITALLLALSTVALNAHPCPFDWNIEFKNATEIKGDSLSDFVAKFNEAAKKETNGKITKVIIYEQKPDTLRKVPENSPFAKDMDVLFQRYATARLRIKKGAEDFGTEPLVMTFPEKIPVACILSAMFDGGATNYSEGNKGALITRRREVLECRAYQINESFFKTTREWQMEGRIPKGMEPVSYLFARFSEMTWSISTGDVNEGPDGTSLLDGVVLYLPEKRTILALETKEKHENISQVMSKRQFLETSASPNKTKKAAKNDH